MPDTQGSIEKILSDLQSTKAGLSSGIAAQRLREYGFNEPVAKTNISQWQRLLKLFATPLAIILLLAAAVTGFTGDHVSAGLIIVMVVASVILDFIQTSRSQNAAEKLRSQVEPVALVLRDGTEREVLRRDLVPGDVIRLVAGDLVPADARLLEARDLHVNEAALTGESLPAEKEVGSSDSTLNSVCLGTSVVSGTAKAIVVATGKNTQFGDIAARLIMRAPETDFERGTREFGFFIMQMVFVLVMFVVIASLAFHRNTFEALMFAVALAVGLTPEFLPMITTVTLGQGALKMSKMKVIVKNLAAIQNLGSIDILCSDKTGTLTTGEMILADHIDPFGVSATHIFLLAYINSLYESGVQNPIDTAVLHRAKLNPLDAAILLHDHPDVHSYQKLDEIPFDFERRRISIVVGNNETGEEGKALLISKGAPESVLPLCTAFEVDGVVQSFDAAARSRAETVYRQLGEQGFRVLAVASRNMYLQPSYGVADEAALVLAGFVTFVDPPLPEAAEVIAQMKSDGVAIKILTGDNEAVAKHVCTSVGMDAISVVLGSELEAMTDPALAQVAEHTDVFARVSPAQKNRIILALKRRGHVVGYMGDGINDAPSLHAADVGISVASAVDVAKDAADVILLEQNLQVLHAGIIEGRKAFGNVMKYLLMGTSSNFGNMFSMAGAFLFLPFLPMLPTQILLNNFLYDLSQVTIPTDNVDETYVHKPHRWNIGFIRKFMLYIGPISSIFDFLTFAVMLKFFHASEQLFHTAWFVESLATQTLVLFIIRTQGNPFRSRPSRPLIITVLAVVIFALVLPYTPLAGVLGFVPLPLSYFAFLAIATTVYLSLVELVKRKLMARLLY